MISTAIRCLCGLMLTSFVASAGAAPVVDVAVPSVAPVAGFAVGGLSVAGRAADPVAEAGLRQLAGIVAAPPAAAPVFQSADPYSSWKPEFEQYLRGLMAEYRLPNLAVQLVDRQGALWQLTLGHRDVARKLPVSSKTLYAIGSTSKAFTGVLLMQLQEQGRLRLDDPVRNYRPDFAVSDARYSAQITLRDLMTHQTGVGRHDLAWYHRGGETRESLFARIPFLEMGAAPRTEFIYNNWMWTTAGLVAEKLTGESWEQLMRARIFLPLRMHASALSVAEVRRYGDYALPYEVGGMGVNTVPFYDIAPMNPAGGIYSNLDDMAEWVRFHLNGGTLHGQTLLSPEGVRESHRGTAAMGGPNFYALGWGTVDFGGDQLLTHDGGIDGFAANVSLMPSKGLGVVVLMNASMVQPQAIALRIWQHVQGMPLKDFVRDTAKMAEEQFEKAVDLYPDLPQVPLERELTGYIGQFCHPAYPAAVVHRGTKADELLVTLSVLRATAYPVGPDRFSIRGQYNDGKIMVFERDPASGQVTTLRWRVESSVKQPLVFTRCP